MKAAKVNVNKRILNALWVYCIASFVLHTVRLKFMNSHASTNRIGNNP